MPLALAFASLSVYTVRLAVSDLLLISPEAQPNGARLNLTQHASIEIDSFLKYYLLKHINRQRILNFFEVSNTTDFLY